MTRANRDEASIRRRFEEAGQGHLFAHLDKASAQQREAFFLFLEGMDLRSAAEAFNSSTSLEATQTGSLQSVVDLVHRDTGGKAEIVEREIGETLLANGEVACLLVAGGQGSRLGFAHPKGMLPVCGKSLFQRFAEQIRILRQRYGKSIPWYLMTSRATHAETADYFSKNDFFGLPRKDIRFFEQGEIPTWSVSGKMLLAGPAQLLTNPDGHGGILAGAQRAGVLADAEDRGVKAMYYFQVDNPLVKIADSYFLGIHERTRADFSLKVVLKEFPQEKLGVPFLVRNAGKKEFRIVEYSDLPAELQANDFGSIAIHAFALSWLKKLATAPNVLPWHRALKKVQALDAKGRFESTEAVKLERFIFDLLPLAEGVSLVETRREEEFAPIKNATGVDSLETAQAALARAGRNE